MALEEVDFVVNASSDVFNQLVIEVGKVGLWIQALGIVIILWVVFQVIALMINLSRKKKLKTIDHSLSRIERKLDRVLKGKKRV